MNYLDYKGREALWSVYGPPETQDEPVSDGSQGESSSIDSQTDDSQVTVDYCVLEDSALLSMEDFVKRADTVVEDTGLRLAQDFCAEAWETHGGLISTLLAAAAQAASGKGLERHGSTELAFEEQPIFTIPVLLGDHAGRGWQLGQALKKIQEAQRFLTNNVDRAKSRAVAELLGAIVYTAAAVMTLDDYEETADANS